MVRNVGAGASPEEWFRSLPPITRWYFATVLLLTAAASFGVINPAQLTLDLPRLWQKFEVWRIPTSFAFFGGFSFPLLIQLYMLVQYSERYEASPFNTGGGGTTADYAWMLAFGMMVMMALALVMPGLVLFGPSMVFMILYMWARKNPESPASMFGFQLQAFYLPWALVAFHILIGNSVFMPLLGIGVGHLYYFLVDVAPEQAGIDIIKTPGFVVDFFGGMAMGAIEGGAPPAHGDRAQPRPQTGHSWGGGRVLGAN